MIFTKQGVWQAVKVIAPAKGFDPHLIMAVCEQESYHPASDLNQYDASVARLEQRFGEKYIFKKFTLATTSEILLACSYGAMQTMGESLREAKNQQGQNFFEWWFAERDEEAKKFFAEPMSMYSMCASLNWYCENLAAQIEWGCLWMLTKKRPDENEAQMLLRWNGGGSPSYPDEVLKRKKRLEAEL